MSQKFVPYRGEANPTIYTKPIKDSKITSIDSGGYVRIGNLVNVNIRCTVGTAVAQYATLFTGLPKPVYDTGLSIGAGVIVCSTNRTILMITTEGVLQNFESTAIPTGILELSATYLCQ